MNNILTMEEVKELMSIEIKEKLPPPRRINSITWMVGTECVTKEKFGSLRCTCRESRSLKSCKNPCLHINAVKDLANTKIEFVG